jgi:ribosomal protein S18 acetylase RimI-like enzyme
VKKQEVDYELTMAASTEDRARIRELVRRFWGEGEQLAFDKRHVVSDLPTWIAKNGRRTIGFVSFADLKDDLLIVALGVLAQYQNAGIGRSLVEKAESEARKSGKRRLLVATSNDDLPALAFYQSLGFRIFDVKPDAIAEKHGQISKGIGGLPIRDELRLQKTLQ